MARQLTLGLNNMNFGTETFKSLMRCTMSAISLANVKVKLPSHKGLKSTTDLSSKRLSSNPIYSRTDINISTGTTHTPVLRQT